MKNMLYGMVIISVISFVVSGCAKSHNPSSPLIQPTDTAIGTATVTETISPTFSITQTETVSQTFSITQTETVSPTFSITQTATPTLTATASPTITPLYESFRRGVYPDASYAGVADAEIYKNYPDSNWGGCAGYGAGVLATSILRSLVKYDVSSISTGVYVVKSTITVQKFYCAGGISQLFYPLTADFIEGNGCNVTTTGTATWNSSGSAPWTAQGGDYQASPASDPLAIDCGFQSFTFTLSNPVVEGWINSPSGNHGLILIAADEVIDANAFRMSSWEPTDPNYRPLLEIYYYRP